MTRIMVSPVRSFIVRHEVCAMWTYAGYVLLILLCGGRAAYLLRRLRMGLVPDGPAAPQLYGYRRQCPPGSVTTPRAEAEQQLLLFVILTLTAIALLAGKIAGYH